MPRSSQSGSYIRTQPQGAPIHRPLVKKYDLALEVLRVYLNPEEPTLLGFLIMISLYKS